MADMICEAYERLWEVVCRFRLAAYAPPRTCSGRDPRVGLHHASKTKVLHRKCHYLLLLRWLSRQQPYRIPNPVEAVPSWSMHERNGIPIRFPTTCTSGNEGDVERRAPSFNVEGEGLGQHFAWVVGGPGVIGTCSLCKNSSHFVEWYQSKAGQSWLQPTLADTQTIKRNA